MTNHELCKNNSDEDDYFNTLLKFDDKNIVLNLCYFKKSNDYTSLIEFIIKKVDKYKHYGELHKLEFFVDLYIDFSNIKMANIDMDFIKMLLRFLQDNYTDIINQIICIHVSIMFKFIYKFLKTVLDKETRDKIVIVSSKNAKKYYELDAYMISENNVQKNEYN